MNGTAASRTASALAALSLCLVVVSGIIPIVTVHGGALAVHPTFSGFPPAIFLPVGCAVIGALIASRQPANPIGWIFIAVGLAEALQFIATDYVSMAYKGSANPPVVPYVAWYESFTQGPVIFEAFPFIFLLFPNGRLISRRWRSVLWFTVLASLSTALWYGLQPGRLTGVEQPITNPFGVPIAAQGPLSLSFSALLLCLLLSAVSLGIRFRRSRGEERQQLKWVALAGIIAALLILSGPFFWFNAVPDALGSVLWPIAFFGAVSILPLSIGVAMLKYRLYDIDLIINRTLVYGSLTLSLASLYIGGVVGLQALARALTGQSSDITVAVATLAVAGLFNPWRKRLQGFIDRRFYRRRYDAARVLATFSSRLRDEVDLDRLSGDLIMATQETLQPRAVVLWLPGRDV